MLCHLLNKVTSDRANPTPPHTPTTTTHTTPPQTGNQTRYRVVTRAEETNGEWFTVELRVRPGAYGADRGVCVVCVGVGVGGTGCG
jgi:hypothetical protein